MGNHLSGPAGSSRRALKAIQPRDDAVDFHFADHALREQLAQEKPSRQLPHFHRILSYDSTFVLEGKAARVLVDRRHAEINIRAQAPIQLHLAFAEAPPPFQRAEIEKAEIDRLLHLVNEGRGEEDPENVSLRRADFSRPVRIGRRRFEESQQ
jgi:hypothetical protein